MEDKGFQQATGVVTTLITNIFIALLNTLILPLGIFNALFTPDGQGVYENYI